MNDDEDGYHYRPWTSRNVCFEVYPRQSEKIEPLMDALVEHYWSRSVWLRRFVEPGIGHSGRVVEVCGFPWWMPRWRALRTVADIANQQRVSGSATFVVERTSLCSD